MDSDVEEMFRKKSSGGRKRSAPGDVLYRQLEQFRGRPYALPGEVNFPHEEDIRLETTRARLSHALKRHEELKERLLRDTDKMVFDRLQKEFEAARASQTEGNGENNYNEGMTIKVPKIIVEVHSEGSAYNGMDRWDEARRYSPC